MLHLIFNINNHVGFRLNCDRLTMVIRLHGRCYHCNCVDWQREMCRYVRELQETNEKLRVAEASLHQKMNGTFLDGRSTLC